MYKGIDNLLIITNGEYAYKRFIEQTKYYTYISVLKVNSLGILNELMIVKQVSKAEACFVVIDCNENGYEKFVEKLSKSSRKTESLMAFITINCDVEKNIAKLRELQKLTDTIIVSETEEVINNINSICYLGPEKAEGHFINFAKECLKDRSIGYSSLGEGTGVKRWERAAINAINDFRSVNHFSTGKNIMLTIEHNIEEGELSDNNEELINNMGTMADIIRIASNKDVNVNFITVIDETLRNRVRVRIFANGYMI